MRAYDHEKAAGCGRLIYETAAMEAVEAFEESLSRSGRPTAQADRLGWASAPGYTGGRPGCCALQMRRRQLLME